MTYIFPPILFLKIVEIWDTVILGSLCRNSNAMHTAMHTVKNIEDNVSVMMRGVSMDKLPHLKGVVKRAMM